MPCPGAHGHQRLTPSTVASQDQTVLRWFSRNTTTGPGPTYASRPGGFSKRLRHGDGSLARRAVPVEAKRRIERVGGISKPERTGKRRKRTRNDPRSGLPILRSRRHAGRPRRLLPNQENPYVTPSTDHTPHLTRRRLLLLLGGSAAGSRLAGCDAALHPRQASSPEQHARLSEAVAAVLAPMALAAAPAAAPLAGFQQATQASSHRSVRRSPSAHRSTLPPAGTARCGRSTGVARRTCTTR